jgi:hypothetical protein
MERAYCLEANFGIRRLGKPRRAWSCNEWGYVFDESELTIGVETVMVRW